MSYLTTRRCFLSTAPRVAAVAAAANSLPTATAWAAEEGVGNSTDPPLKIGLMTYLLGKDWDINTIIQNCSEAKFEHVELRTTHAHGVEVSLSAPSGLPCGNDLKTRGSN